MEGHTEREGMRFHVLRVKNRFDPALDRWPELLNGGYRDINIKLKIGFSEGKNGRAELMTVCNLRCLATLAERFNGLNADSIYLRWKSGRVTNQTIASCVKCRWGSPSQILLSTNVCTARSFLLMH